MNTIILIIKWKNYMTLFLSGKPSFINSDSFPFGFISLQYVKGDILTKLKH